MMKKEHFGVYEWVCGWSAIPYEDRGHIRCLSPVACDPECLRVGRSEEEAVKIASLTEIKIDNVRCSGLDKEFFERATMWEMP